MKSNSRRGLLSGAGAVAIIVAFAANPAVAQLGPDEAEQRSNTDEIIVSGKRSTPGGISAGVDVLGNKSILDTPMAVQVYTAETLQNLQVRSLDGIVALQGGASTRTNDAAAGGAFFQVRGFDISRTLMDGQPGAGGIGTLRTNVPIELFDNIQIISSASSLVSGFASPGGTINFIAKQPLREPAAEVTLGFAGPSLFVGHADLSIVNADQTVGARFNILGESGEQETASTRNRRLAAALNLGFKLSDTTRLRVDGLYSRRTINGAIQGLQVGYNTALGAPKPIDGSTSLAPRDSRYGSEIKSLSVTLIQDIGDNWVAKVNGSIARARLEQAADFPRLTSVTGDYQSRYRYFNTDDDTRSAAALVKGKLRTGPFVHDISFGGAIERYDQYYDTVNNDINANYFTVTRGGGNIYTGEYVVTPYTGPRFNTSTKTAVTQQDSLFISDIVSLGYGFELLGAARAIWLRYENYANATGNFSTSAVSPTYGIIYKPARNISTYFTYSDAVNRGDQAPLQATNAREILPPKTATQYELGVKAEFGRLLLTGALFQIAQEYSFCIGTNGIVDAPGCTSAYYGKQQHRGLEFAVSGQATRNTTVIAGFQYLDPVIKNDPIYGGYRPVTIPRYNAKLFVEQTIPFLEGLHVNGGVQYSSGSFLDAFNQIKLDGYTLVDLGARYEFELNGTRLNLRLKAENLFDKKFFYPRQTLEIGAPRVVRASLSVSF